jgi:tRNA1Val (adenine37-N6)-methyltransferase
VRQEKEDTDRLGLGELRLHQRPEFFKYTIDPVLLAAFIRVYPRHHVLDLGTGVGVIPLWLAGYRGVRRVTGLELQEEMAALAAANVILNKLEERIKIVQGDLREPPPEITGERFDWVVSNPPYRKAGDGPVSENPILARARFEITCTLEEVVAAAARLLREGGQAALIHLPERLTDLFYLFREYRLEPKRLCLVYPRPGMPPHRVLLEGRKGARGGLKVLKPFFLHSDSPEAGEKFTREMLEVYRTGSFPP